MNNLIINEIKAERIFNPTSIDLGEYVVNPYMGCKYSCLYCYVRSNKAVNKKKESWGEFIDVRINAPELLKKEIKIKKPKTVLLGSTTECFQPIEKKYKITEQIINILNENKIFYVILTRSPNILDSIDLLKKGYCKQIYFTFNDFAPEFKKKLEPKSPFFKNRLNAINKLIDNNINVVPYFSPVLPWISNLNYVFEKIKNNKLIEFECLNFNLKNINEIIDRIGEVDLNLSEKYRAMIKNKLFFKQVWKDIMNNIRQNAGNNREIVIYNHEFGDFFVNKYKS